MRRLKKILIFILITNCLLIWVMAISDQNLNSVAFMDDNEIRVIKRWADLIDRKIASRFADQFEGKLSNENQCNELNPSTIRLLKNKENSSRVDGVWKIYRLIGATGNEEMLNMEVEFKLLDSSRIIIEDDEEQVFQISKFHISPAGKHIAALFKSMGDCQYEIIEAQKIDSNKLKRIKSKKTSKIKSKKRPRKRQLRRPVYQQEYFDFILNSAQNISSKIRYKKVTGSLTVVERHIRNLEVVLDDRVMISIGTAEIGDAGVFGQQDEITDVVHGGMIIREGPKKWKVTMITGMLKGATFHFVEENSYQESQDEKNFADGFVDEDDSAYSNPVIENQLNSAPRPKGFAFKHN